MRGDIREDPQGGSLHCNGTGRGSPARSGQELHRRGRIRHQVSLRRARSGGRPLEPLDKLVFSLGPFTGTTIPCASRMAVSAKSPLTNTIGVALTGGHFPTELNLPGMTR